MNGNIYKETFDNIYNQILESKIHAKNGVEMIDEYESDIIDILDSKSKSYILTKNLTEYTINYQFQQMICILIEKMGFKINKLNSPKISFYIIKDNVKIGYYATTSPDFKLTEYYFENKILDRIQIILCKNISEDSEQTRKKMRYPNNSLKKYNALIDILTIKEFLLSISEEDYNLFTIESDNINKKIKENLSFRTIVTPTKVELDHFKIKLKKDLLDYSDSINKYSLSTKYDIDIDTIKKEFDKKYALLISDECYARSFISSEWFYNTHQEDTSFENIEQTGIISGYLKSVEQLLYSINNCLFENSNDCGDMMDALITNLFNIKHSYFAVGEQSIRVCKRILYDYKNKYRNEYFHKGNLYTKNEIEAIRNETFKCLYIILGCINLPSNYCGFTNINN